MPRGLEQLLDRASIMETSLGDMANVSGTVGVLSIQNREEIRLSVDDGSYMAFLNDSYAVIDRQLASAGGLFLSSGFHPGGMEFLFRGSPDQGLAFALGLQGEMTAQEQEHTPDFFLLLHGASFLYGLVGSEERTFPLLSSSEIAFLQTLPANSAAPAFPWPPRRPRSNRLTGRVPRATSALSRPTTGNIHINCIRFSKAAPISKRRSAFPMTRSSRRESACSVRMTFISRGTCFPPFSRATERRHRPLVSVCV